MDPAALAAALQIAQLVEGLAPALIGLVTQAIAAAQSNDQPTLDKILASVTAAADSLKP